MKKKTQWIAALLLSSLSAAPVSAARLKDPSQVESAQLTRDLQKMVNASRQLSLVWWIPQEFWQVSLAKDKTLNEAGRDQMLNVMASVDVVAVVQTDVSAMGSFDFYPRAEVEAGLQLTHVAPDGRRTRLKTIEPKGDVQLLLAQLKPVLQGAMGNLGANMHFFTYPRGKGARVLDPTVKGQLEFAMKVRSGSTQQVQIETPINALFEPRLCPDGREAHVSWNFCPWDGSRLPD